MTTTMHGEGPTGADWERFGPWVDHLFEQTPTFPVNFVYGGSPVRGIPAEWSPVRSFRRFGSTIVQTTYEGRHPGTGLGLRVEVERYLDYPVLEWTAWLTNHSDRPTPRVHDLTAVDATFKGAAGAVYHGNGDFYSNDGYMWETTAMEGRAPLDVSPNGGRPCDGAFPYFRLLFADGGLTMAIGWPGEWHARFSDDAGGGISVRAGQDRTDMTLLPGETVRTPRVTLMGWAGDQAHAVNLWRRWYRAHVMPRPGGQPARPLLSASGTDEGVEFTAATEANQLEYQRRWAAQGVDYDIWWIDAGWYPCTGRDGKRDWTITGTWHTDPDRFPDGLAKVSEGARAHGAELLLWFEPERVFPGTELAVDRPDWVLARPRTDADEGQKPHRTLSGLLDLSNPACRAWLTDYVSGLISSYGIGVYRQDFNFPPLDYWRGHDAEDRQGITENLHVQGYLAFWDELLERHPALLIDSCASGGRRNDLETMRRSVPLHYTDWGYGQHPTKLDFHRTMFEWLPYFKETSLSWDIPEATQEGLDAKEGDSFAFHCALAPMLAPAVDIKRTDNDFGIVRQMVGVWRSISEILLDGDYYSLTPPGRSGKEWVVWQFNRPLDNSGRAGSDGAGSDGFVQAIRLAGADEEQAKVKLRGLRPETVYLLQEAETGEHRERRGSSLMDDGFVFELPRRRGSIWTYREKTS
ncbi:MAG TPA: alpha-galactosidase [Acidimicrobiales bacterium]|nr:alpha-galactosidase [Acidimicrobiales bacterium]